MKKLSRSNWVEFGFKILTEEGESSIRIDRLCEKQNVSKGSFYHHFLNIDEYIKELLKYWMEINTAEIIRLIEGIKEFNEKTECLEKTGTRRLRFYPSQY